MEYDQILNRLFSKKEIDTMCAITSTCPCCKNQCGHLFLLNECRCPVKRQMCGNCVDELYDCYDGFYELFRCKCDAKIFSIDPCE